MKGGRRGLIVSLIVGVWLVARATTQDLGFGSAKGPGARAWNTFLNNALEQGISPWPTGSPAGANPLDVATGDFNGDGFPDIAVGSTLGGAGSVQIFTGLGDGAFGLPISIPTMNLPTAVAAGDIDLDGISDLAVAGVDYASDFGGQLRVFSGRTIANNILAEDLTVAPTTWLSGVPTSIAIGRLDGDAVADVALGLDYGGGQGGVEALFNPFAGGGSSRPPETIWNTKGGTPVLSIEDRAIFGGTADGVLSARFDQQFSTTRLHVHDGSEPTSMTLADLDGDEYADIIALYRNGDAVFNYGGREGFAAPQTIALGGNPATLRVGDFNADGFADLAVATSGPSRAVSVLTGNGKRVFSPSATLPLSALPSLYAASHTYLNPNPKYGASVNVESLCLNYASACGSGIALPLSQWAVSLGGLNADHNATFMPGENDDHGASWLGSLQAMRRAIGGWLTLMAPRTPAASIRYASEQTLRPAVQPVQVVLTATGASSGDFFEMQIIDAAGKLHRGVVPEGAILEPILAPPVVAPPRAGVVSSEVGGFCMDFAKEVPNPGTRYRLASPDAQRRFGPLRNILSASRHMALRGLLHPDGSPGGYFNSVRQYAVWAKQENWDIKKFGESFVERTKKNLLAAKGNWTQPVEQAVRAAIPGRWRDIEEVLRLSNQIASR